MGRRERRQGGKWSPDRMGGVNHSGRDETVGGGLGHSGHPSLLLHCTSGWEGAQHSTWSTPFPHSMLKSHLTHLKLWGVPYSQK